jgi:predicted RecB family nuclease
VENISKEMNKVSLKDESFEEYTDKEIEYLDKYKEFTNYRFEDDELYNIITKYNFDDERIKRELTDMLKLITKKGDEYGWQVVEKGKSKYS